MSYKRNIVPWSWLFYVIMRVFLWYIKNDIKRNPFEIYIWLLYALNVSYTSDRVVSTCISRCVYLPVPWDVGVFNQQSRLVLYNSITRAFAIHILMWMSVVHYSVTHHATFCSGHKLFIGRHYWRLNSRSHIFIFETRNIICWEFRVINAISKNASES